jgi:hypothetical protein
LFTGRFTHGTRASVGYADRTLLVNYATQW